MFIPVYLLTAIVIIGLLIPGYRPTIINIFTSLWNLICGLFSRLWNFISGNAPNVGAGAVSIFRRIIALILLLVLIAIIIVILGYVLLGGAMLALGSISGNFGLTMLMLLLLIIYGFIGIFPSNFLFKAVRAIISLVVTGMLIYISGTIIWTAFGKISPEVQKSATRASKNTAGELANKLDKYSLQSEKESGIFARVKNDCRVYNSKNQSFTSLKKDDLVYILNTEGKQKNTDGEGMTQIMLSNQDGDFIGGKRGWIVSRVIDWNSSETTPESTITNNAQSEGRKVIMEVSISGSEFPQSIDILPPGEYEINFHPVAAAAGATYCVVLPDKEWATREIKNNSISVKGGEKAFAIWTEIPSKVELSQK